MPTLDGIPSTTVVGAGFIALDVLLNGNDNEHFRRRAGGTCGNVLAILSFLGFHSVPIARLGMDEAADLLLSDLRDIGVDCQHIQRDEAASTPRVVELLPDQPGNPHCFVFRCPLCQHRFPRRKEPNFDRAKNSLYDLKPRMFFFDRAGPNTVKLAKKARQSGAIVVFEPDSFRGGPNFNLAMQSSDVIKYSIQRTRKSIEPWLQQSNSKPFLVVETLDSGGLRYMTRPGLDGFAWNQQQPFFVEKPADQAGAGDWCSAGLMAGILSDSDSEWWHERNIQEYLALGQALAAASILFQGPRGYLEKISRTSAIRAAISTVRRGQLPGWLSRNTLISSDSATTSDSVGSCGLCLMPNSPI